MGRRKRVFPSTGRTEDWVLRQWHPRGTSPFPVRRTLDRQSCPVPESCPGPRSCVVTPRVGGGVRPPRRIAPLRPPYAPSGSRITSPSRWPGVGPAGSFRPTCRRPSGSRVPTSRGAPPRSPGCGVTHTHLIVSEMHRSPPESTEVPLSTLFSPRVPRPPDSPLSVSGLETGTPCAPRTLRGYHGSGRPSGTTPHRGTHHVYRGLGLGQGTLSLQCSQS